MILNYVFEDVMCDVLYDGATHINNGWFEPHYCKKLCEVNYDYEVDVTFKDFFDFIKPFDFNHWGKDGRLIYERACKDVWDSDWLKLDELEKDEDFIQFMKERYEDKARERYQEEND